MARDNKDVTIRLETLIEAYKVYFEAKLAAVNNEDVLRDKQMKQMHHDLVSKHEVAVDTALADRERIMGSMQQRFIEQDRATLLVDAKNEIRFAALESDTQTIMATYALRENLDKSTLLAKQSVDERFVALDRERDEANVRRKESAVLTAQGIEERFLALLRERDEASSRFKEAIGQVTQSIDKTDFIAKERILALTQHTDAQVESQEVATRLVATTVDIRFTNIDRATTLANDALEKRLEGINEFREQLRDQAARFVTREESESKLAAMTPVITALQERIVELEKNKANGEGRVWAFGIVITVVSIGVSVALHFVR